MHKPETLSALFDDEGSIDELAALGALAAEDDTSGLWSRYQMIGDTLRGGHGDLFADAGFAARVREGVAGEPVPVLEASIGRTGPTADVVALSAARRPGAWRPALGLAAAASVTAFMLGLWTAEPMPGGLPVAASAPAPLPASQELVGPAAVGVAVSDAGQAEHVSSLPEAEYRRRMDNYLMNFNEQRARMGMPQAHAYVRVVGFDTPTEQP